ncbi:MAG: hypothetical protein JO069_18465 [Verrucomicrobia bacterium]|nr:hypothetical protein [Verrucomicrobiota bacterium]
MRLDETSCSTAPENPGEEATLILSRAAVENFKGKRESPVVPPTDAGHDEVRQRGNATLDRRPALLMRCADAQDASPFIAFAREYGLELSPFGP